jgi:hypothetical protein
VQGLQEICEARRPFDWELSGIEGLVPSHFEKLAGRRRLPPGLVGARFTSRHVCEVLRKSALSVIAGHFDRAETKVRPRTGRCETISSGLI